MGTLLVDWRLLLGVVDDGGVIRMGRSGGLGLLVDD
jgi:hypothetical protein